MTDLAELTAVELLQGYAAGSFTPVDATEAALRRIDERNGDLNAFVLVDRESAIASAEASAGRWMAHPARIDPYRRGRALGRRCPLRGPAP